MIIKNVEIKQQTSLLALKNKSQKFSRSDTSSMLENISCKTNVFLTLFMNIDYRLMEINKFRKFLTLSHF